MAEVVAEGVVLLSLRENLDREMAAAKAKVEAGMKAIDAEEAELRVKNEKALKAVDQLRERQEKAIADVAAAQEAGDKKAERLANARLKTATAGLDKWAKANAALHKRLAALDFKRTKVRVDSEKAVSKAREAVARQVEKDAQQEIRTAQKVADERRKAANDAAKAEADAAKASAKAQAEAAKDASKAKQAAAARAFKAEENARNRNLRLELAAIAAETAANKLAAKAESDAEKRKQAEIKETTRLREKAEAQERKDEAAARRADEQAQRRAEAEANRERREADRRTAAFEQEKGQIAQLTAKYADLAKQRRVIERREGSVMTSPSEKVTLRINREGIEEAMMRLRERLVAMNADPIHINIDVDDDSNALSNFARRLSETSVRVGPFTTSLGNLFRILATGGPIVMGLVTAIGSLGAVAAGAATGGIGILGAAFTGFLPMIAGAGMALTPFISGTKKATDAAKKLAEAEIEHGKGSDEAKDAQKELNTILGNVDPASKKAAMGIARLKASFKDFTGGPAREAFSQVMDSVLSAGNKLLPMFTVQTNKFMDTASDGIDGWMDRLSSKGGRKGLGDLFGNVNEALGPLMSGMESLGAVVGRTFVEFSDHLPRIAEGFEDWAQNLDKVTKSGDGIGTFVESTMNSLSSLWGLFKAGGRVIQQFVRAATGGTREAAPAIALVDDMTNTLNDWADSMSTVEGQTGIRDFLNDFNDTARATWHAIEPLVKLFAEFSSITRPLITPLIEVVGLFGDLVAALAGFGPVRVMLQGAFALFLGGMLASKIGGAITLFRQLAGVIKSVGVAGAGLRALDFLTGGGIGPLSRRARPPMTPGAYLPPVTPGVPMGPASRAPRPAPAPRPVPAAAPRQVVRRPIPSTRGVAMGSRVLRDAAALGTTYAVAARGPSLFAKALTSVSTATKGLRFGPLAAGATALGLATGALAAGLRKPDLAGWNEQMEAGTDLAGKANSVYHQLTRSATGTALAYHQTSDAVKAARKELEASKPGTQRRTYAMLNLRSALDASKVAQEDWNESVSMARNTAQKGVVGTLNQLEAHDKLNQSLKDEAQAVLDGNSSMYSRAQAQKILADLERDRVPLIDAVTAAENRMFAVNANMARQLQGMAPVLGRAEQQLGRLAKINPRMAKKISLTYEAPKDVGRVAAQASRAISRGAAPKQVMRIVADSRGAQADLRRLDALGDQVTRKRRRVALEAIDRATNPIRKVLQNLGLLPKDTDTDLKATDRARNVVDGVMRLFGLVPKKTDTDLNANDRTAGGVGTAKANLGALPPSVDIPVTVTVSQKRGFSLGGAIGSALSALGFATGGLIEPHATGGRTNPNVGALPYLQKRAAVVAERKSMIPRSGTIVRSPRILVGEEATHPEYVIATNPAYRERNRKLVSRAAEDLGMAPLEAAATGREADRRRRGRPAATAAGRKPPNKKNDGRGDDDPKPRSRRIKEGQVYTAGGRPVDIDKYRPTSERAAFDPTKKGKKGQQQVQTMARRGSFDPSIGQTIISDFDSLVRQIASAENQVEAAIDRRKKVKKKVKKKKADGSVEMVQNPAYRTATNSVQAARKRKNGLIEDRDKLAGKYNLARMNEKQMTAMGRVRDRADAAEERMGSASIKGSPDMFYAAREDRLKALKDLRNKKQRAFNSAREPYKSQLKKELNAIKGEIDETNNASFQGAVDVAAGLTQPQAGLLQKIKADIALAEAGQGYAYQDAWKAIPGMVEGGTAKQALTAFWQARLDEARAKNADKNKANDVGADVIGGIAAELAASKEAPGGAEGPPEIAVTPGQLLGTEKASLLRDFASNAYAQGIGTQSSGTAPSGSAGTNPATLSDPYSGGDVGGYGDTSAAGIAAGRAAGSTLGARSAGVGGGTIITGGGSGGGEVKNIYVQPTYATVPEDPHTYTKNVGYEIAGAL